LRGRDGSPSLSLNPLACSFFLSRQPRLAHTRPLPWCCTLARQKGKLLVLSIRNPTQPDPDIESSILVYGYLKRDPDADLLDDHLILHRHYRRTALSTRSRVSRHSPISTSDLDIVPTRFYTPVRRVYRLQRLPRRSTYIACQHFWASRHSLVICGLSFRASYLDKVVAILCTLILPRGTSKKG
jgi:hypothetical protein